MAPFMYTLRRYASASRVITEVGVDDGSSTLPLLLGRPEAVYSFDLWRQPEIDQIEEYARELKVDFHFSIGDSRNINIPVCDFLFLDGDHVTEVVALELERHCNQVQKYIFLHDTQTCGDRSCQLGSHELPWIGPGLWAAIGPFLRRHSEWYLGYVTHESCGLAGLFRR